jgi:hypothetical protein
LIKTDDKGNEEWNRTFIGDGQAGAEGYSVQQTTDGGYIIVGGTVKSGYGNKADVFLIKTDGYGDMIWDKTFGGKNDDMGFCVQQTTDGGYIIAGITDSFGAGWTDVLLIKTDSQGKSKTTSFDNLWFERLFQRFPNAFPLLRQLMEY